MLRSMSEKRSALFMMGLFADYVSMLLRVGASEAMRDANTHQRLGIDR